MRVLMAIVLLGVAGCGLFGPPSWVRTYPTDEGWVYGIGSSGETYDRSPSRAEEIAKQRALDDLARQIRVRVLSATVLTDLESWSSYRADTVQFTDEDLRGIEIVEVWVDDTGSAGAAGRTWVLLRIPRDQAEEIAARDVP